MFPLMKEHLTCVTTPNQNKSKELKMYFGHIKERCSRLHSLPLLPHGKCVCEPGLQPCAGQCGQRAENVLGWNKSQ